MPMVQFGVGGNCCNDCKFCTRKMRRPYSKKKMISSIDFIIKNINYIDGENKFSHGISLLGRGIIFYNR